MILTDLQKKDRSKNEEKLLILRKLSLLGEPVRRQSELLMQLPDKQQRQSERTRGPLCARNRDNFHDDYRVQHLDNPRYICSSRIQLDDETQDQATPVA